MCKERGRKKKITEYPVQIGPCIRLYFCISCAPSWYPLLRLCILLSLYILQGSRLRPNGRILRPKSERMRLNFTSGRACATSTFAGFFLRSKLRGGRLQLI